MTEWIHGIELLLSGGIVMALFKFAALIGAMQQAQQDQREEIKETKDSVKETNARLSRVEHALMRRSD
jgi:hypothetical protein